MAADLAGLGGVREGFPAVCHDTQITVADTAVGKIDQDLAGAGSGCVEVDYLGGDLAGLVVDDRLVGLGNVWRSHCCWSMELVW